MFIYLFFLKICSLLASVKVAAGVLKLKMRLCRMLNADPGRKQTLALAVSVGLKISCAVQEHGKRREVQ